MPRRNHTQQSTAKVTPRDEAESMSSSSTERSLDPIEIEQIYDSLKSKERTLIDKIINSISSFVKNASDDPSKQDIRIDIILKSTHKEAIKIIRDTLVTFINRATDSQSEKIERIHTVLKSYCTEAIISIHNEIIIFFGNNTISQSRKLPLAKTLISVKYEAGIRAKEMERSLAQLAKDQKYTLPCAFLQGAATDTLKSLPVKLLQRSYDKHKNSNWQKPNMKYVIQSIISSLVSDQEVLPNIKEQQDNQIYSVLKSLDKDATAEICPKIVNFINRASSPSEKDKRILAVLQSRRTGVIAKIIPMIVGFISRVSSPSEKDERIHAVLKSKDKWAITEITPAIADFINRASDSSEKDERILHVLQSRSVGVIAEIIPMIVDFVNRASNSSEKRERIHAVLKSKSVSAIKEIHDEILNLYRRNFMSESEKISMLKALILVLYYPIICAEEMKESLSLLSNSSDNADYKLPILFLRNASKEILQKLPVKLIESSYNAHECRRWKRSRKEIIESILYPSASSSNISVVQSEVGHEQTNADALSDGAHSEDDAVVPSSSSPQFDFDSSYHHTSMSASSSSVFTTALSSPNDFCSFRTALSPEHTMQSSGDEMDIGYPLRNISELDEVSTSGSTVSIVQNKLNHTSTEQDEQIYAVLKSRSKDAIEKVIPMMKSFVTNASDDTERAKRIYAILKTKNRNAIAKIIPMIMPFFINTSHDHEEQDERIHVILKSRNKDAIAEVIHMILLFVNSASEASAKQDARIQAVLTSRNRAAIAEVTHMIVPFIMRASNDKEKAKRIHTVVEPKNTKVTEIILSTILEFAKNCSDSKKVALIKGFISARYYPGIGSEEMREPLELLAKEKSYSIPLQFLENASEEIIKLLPRKLLDSSFNAHKDKKWCCHNKKALIERLLNSPVSSHEILTDTTQTDTSILPDNSLENNTEAQLPQPELFPDFFHFLDTPAPLEHGTVLSRSSDDEMDTDDVDSVNANSEEASASSSNASVIQHEVDALSDTEYSDSDVVVLSPTVPQAEVNSIPRKRTRVSADIEEETSESSHFTTHATQSAILADTFSLSSSRDCFFSHRDLSAVENSPRKRARISLFSDNEYDSEDSLRNEPENIFRKSNKMDSDSLWSMWREAFGTGEDDADALSSSLLNHSK